MGLKINIKAKYNYKKIEEITKKLPKATTGGLEEILKNIRGCAIRLERGHNENGILIEMIETSTMKVKGRVYTDKANMPYALFEHFGTRTIC